MIAVMKYFNYPNAASFSKDWKQLTPEDQAQLRAGIEDGRLRRAVRA